MDSVKQRLFSMLNDCGYKAEMISINHIKDLEKEIIELHTNGKLDEKFFDESLKSFRYNYQLKIPNVKSVIVVAMPQPITKLSFSWHGKHHEVIIPPTYVYEEVDKRVIDILENVLKEEGYQYTSTWLPLKLLAVRSGLSMYGRNNISYIPGMGSFYRILSFATDMECEEDNWQEAGRMKCCDACSLCLNSCPTKCIDSQRFLIHAENCLTNLNESEEDFPDWVDIKWHNALIGCMNCQMVCPQNKECIRIVKIDDAFTEDEISSILNKTEIDMLSDKTKSTLQRLGLMGYYRDNVIHRNLGVLLGKR